MLITYPRIHSQDTRYAYAVARIRALEVKLLSFHKIARLLESDSVEELLRNLQDTDYSQWLPDSPRDYEHIIRNARADLYNLIDELVIDKIFVEFLRLKYDYFNAKLLVKGTIGEKETDRLLSDFGNISKQELKSIFVEERYDKLLYGLSKAIPEAISVYYTTNDPRFLDIVLDKFYYSYLLEQSYINSFLETLIKIEIDLINIKTMLRIKLLKEEPKLLIKSFIPGSWLELSRFSQCLAEPMESIPRYFEWTPYAKILNDGVEYLQTKESFLRLERGCDNHIIEFLKGAKHLAFGIEPIIAYFYAKENEFKILRMIFVGKLNRVPDELIKERLPEVY